MILAGGGRLEDSECGREILPENGFLHSLEFVFDGSVVHPVSKNRSKQGEDGEDEEDLKEWREQFRGQFGHT